MHGFSGKGSSCADEVFDFCEKKVLNVDKAHSISVLKAFPPPFTFPPPSLFRSSSLAICRVLPFTKYGSLSVCDLRPPPFGSQTPSLGPAHVRPPR